MNYEAIEDCAGGLHLFVFDDNKKAIYEHSGYENRKGQLIADMQALNNGCNVHDFDGCEDDPQGDYDFIANEIRGGYSVIASGGSYE